MLQPRYAIHHTVDHVTASGNVFTPFGQVLETINSPLAKGFLSLLDHALGVYPEPVGADPKELELAGHQPTATPADPIHFMRARVS